MPTLTRFFDRELAIELRREGRRADLLVCNNTLAQVPGLNDFVAGMALLLAPDGTLTIEVPHLLRLLAGNRVRYDLPRAFLVLLARVDPPDPRRHTDSRSWTWRSSRPTVGRSGSTSATPPRRSSGRGSRRSSRGSSEAGLEDVATYAAFGARVAELKRSVLSFLIGLHRDGRTVAGYGAPGKANTLLNYCGIGPDLLPYTVDRNPYKHGRFTPGTRIPIHHPDRLVETRPDYIWILPWNLRREIALELSAARDWGARLFVAIPRPEVFDVDVAAAEPIGPAVGASSA